MTTADIVMRLAIGAIIGFSLSRLTRIWFGK
jgi:hypothetical protein